MTASHSPKGQTLVVRAIEAALRANRLSSPYPMDSPEYEPWERKQLVRLWHKGARRGHEVETLYGILAAARGDGACPDDVAGIATEFAGRCSPPMDSGRVQMMVEGIVHSIRHWDPLVEAERSGPSADAWRSGVWDESDLSSLGRTDPNGAPVFFPLYFLTTTPPHPRKHRGKIQFLQALERWVDTRPTNWHLADPLHPVAEKVLRWAIWCGTRKGIRSDEKHRTVSLGHKICRHRLHETCHESVIHKAEEVIRHGSRPPYPHHMVEMTADAVKDVHTFVTDRVTLVRMAAPVPWPWQRDHLENALRRLRDAFRYRSRKEWPEGGLVGLRVEPFRGKLALYALVPGPVRVSRQPRGRPTLYRPSIVGQYAGREGLQAFREHVGGSWAGMVPDDEHAAESARMLLEWSPGKSRVHGFRTLGTRLAKVELVSRCPVCGARTRDDGFFEEHRHAKEVVTDPDGKQYPGVVDLL